MGAPRNPVRPAVLDSEAARLVERQDISRSSEFRAFCQQQKLDAQRRKDDFTTEIDRFETERQRLAADHATALSRLDQEIAARMKKIEGEDEIIARADAALTLDLAPVLQPPAPQLTEHTPSPAPEGESS